MSEWSRSLLPFTTCEALETSGASSVASVSVATLASGQEVVVVGSNNGYVYMITGRHESSRAVVSWRKLAIPVTADTPLPNDQHTSILDAASYPLWHVPEHHRIQAVATIGHNARSSKGDDGLTIVVLVVSRATKHALIYVYHASQVGALLTDPHIPTDMFPVVEWRRMSMSLQTFPLRFFVDPLFASVVDARHTTDEPPGDHILISAMVVDATHAHIATGTLGVLSLPHSGPQGVAPPMLQWTAPGSGEHGGLLVWVVYRTIKLLHPQAAVSAVHVVPEDDKTTPRLLVVGYVDGHVIVAHMVDGDGATEAHPISTIRGSGPIADLVPHHRRIALPFVVPSAVLDVMEDGRPSFQAHTDEAACAPVRILAVDSSGKVMSLVLRRHHSTQVAVTVTLLHDCSVTVEAKLAAKQADKAAPAVKRQHLPDSLLGLSTYLWRHIKAQRSSPIEEQRPDPTPSSQLSTSASELAAKISFPNTDEVGALLGAGPIYLASCDVDGDGVQELIITTLGRFVALYRFQPDLGTFACAEIAEAPSHMYFCKQVRLWPHTAVPAWIMCGPSHILAHGGSTLRDLLVSRAFALERCLVGEASVHNLDVET